MRRTRRIIQDDIVEICQKSLDKEKHHSQKRLPLETWIQRMDKIMVDCLNKFEMYSNNEWNLAIQKIEKMKASGVPYRSHNDENFKNALDEVELLFSKRNDEDMFAESILSMVSYYARSKRRKAMEEIAFVLMVTLIQPQLMMNEAW